MPHSGTERVWILGAGFSRSLGGPLLSDLLSQGHYMLLKARFPQLAGPCAPVIGAFTWGLQGIGLSTPGLWPNAESFLEFIDAADPGTAGDQILRGYLGDALDIDDFRLRARQAITSSCWGFVKDKPRSVFTEAWMPYVGW